MVEAGIFVVITIFFHIWYLFIPEAKLTETDDLYLRVGSLWISEIGFYVYLVFRQKKKKIVFDYPAPGPTTRISFPSEPHWVINNC
jgi:hypothetical protein